MEKAIEQLEEVMVSPIQKTTYLEKGTEHEEEEYGYCPEELTDELEDEWIASQKKKRKKKQERKKHYESGYRNILIRLLLTGGAISYSGIDMLPGNKRMYLRKLKDMEAERVVDIVRSNKRKIARINYFEKNYTKYINDLALGYYGYYNKHGKNTKSKIVLKEKEGVTAERCIKDVEIIQLLYGAGVKTLYDEKQDINSGKKLKENEVVYYTIGELRTYDEIQLNLKLEKDANNSITSRVHGLLISPGGKYPVYHTGNTIMIWKKSTEGQIAQYTSQIVNQKCEQSFMKGQAKECIILGYNMEVFKKIYFNTKKGNLTLDSGYSTMYAIPYNTFGQKMLSRMTTRNWREKLNRDILPDYKLPGSLCEIVCDGIKDETFALNFCNANITRLRSFYAGMEWKRKTSNYIFEVYCYPFQEEFVRSIFEKHALIKLVEERIEEEVD